MEPQSAWRNWNSCKLSLSCDRKSQLGHTSQSHSHVFLTHIFFWSHFFNDFEIDAQWVLNGNSHLNLFEMSLELMQTELWSESGLWIEIIIWPTRFSHLNLFERFWNWCKLSCDRKWELGHASQSDPHVFHISIFFKCVWNSCKLCFDQKVSCEWTHAIWALIEKWVLNGNYNLTHTLFSS